VRRRGDRQLGALAQLGHQPLKGTHRHSRVLFGRQQRGLRRDREASRDVECEQAGNRLAGRRVHRDHPRAAILRGLGSDVERGTDIAADRHVAHVESGQLGNPQAEIAGQNESAQIAAPEGIAQIDLRQDAVDVVV